MTLPEMQFKIDEDGTAWEFVKVDDTDYGWVPMENRLAIDLKELIKEHTPKEYKGDIEWMRKEAGLYDKMETHITIKEKKDDHV